MSTITSTVPGAISALFTHFTAVAAAHSSFEAKAYLGLPMGPGQANTFLMVGDHESGELVTDYEQVFRTLGVQAGSAVRNEEYVIPCTIQAWAGTAPPAASTAQTQRITWAFTLLDGVLQKLQTDPTGGGSLTSSGTWEVTRVQIPVSGPLTGQGWGVILTFEVHVFNVTLY